MHPNTQDSTDIETLLNTKEFKILVADDDEDARNLLGIALDNDGWQLSFCENGDQTQLALNKSLPDLLISDIQMPGKNGIQLCTWVKENCGQIFTPVILLTSRAELTDKVAGLNCGADDYITKPFALPELEARVRALLRIKLLTDQLKKTQNLLAEKEKQLLAISIAGGAAHELGQPLTSVLLNCQLLTKIDPNQKAFSQTLKSIETQCQRMKTILTELNRLENYSTTDYPGDLKILKLNPDSAS